MHSEPGIGVECILQLLGAEMPDGTAARARTYVGAALILETILTIRALARALASG